MKSQFFCASGFVDKVYNKITISLCIWVCGQSTQQNHDFLCRRGGSKHNIYKEIMFSLHNVQWNHTFFVHFFSLKCTLELRLCCIVCNRVQLPLHNFLYFFMYIRGEFVSESQFFCVTKTPKKHKINISLCNFCTT